MKRKLLVVTTVLVVAMMATFLFACGGEDKPQHPDWAYEEVLGKEAEQAKLYADSDTRIMSYNIQADAWGGSNRDNAAGGIKSRAEQLEKMLELYSPDVVGLQEVCYTWHGALPKMIAGKYAMHKLSKGSLKYTAMIYNTETVKVVESGREKYSKHDPNDHGKMRVVEWMVFEKINGGQKFVVLNTHFDFGKKEEEKKTEMRRVQIKEFSDKANELKTKYNAPTFMLGDLNFYDQEITDEKHPAFDYHQSVYLYDEFAKYNKDKFVEAKKIPNLPLQGGSILKATDPTWDHLFVSDASIVKRFSILANKYYTTISDHYPIFVDVKIAK